MKIDNATKLFVERYDQEALSSIDALSQDIGLLVTNAKFKAFNINESFNQFTEFLRGYGKYKIENVNNPEATPQEVIKESFKKFIDEKLFQECEIKYEKIPEFVRGFIEGTSSLSTALHDVKSDMMNADVQIECVGDSEEFVEYFMDRLYESFNPTMDRILWASGYNTRNALFNRKGKKVEKPVFL